MTPGRAPCPVVIGHRGAAAVAPENTLASLRAALATGALWVEFDIRLTADRHPVLLHDATLDRTTDASGPLSTRTREALGGIDAGAWFDPRFAGEPLPTLGEALDLLHGRACAVVELKTSGEDDRDLPAVVAEKLASCGQDVVVTSKHWAPLAALRSSCPGVPIALTFSGIDPRDPIASATRLGAAAIHPNRKRIDRGFVERAHRAGLAVRPYTVNTPAQIAWATTIGVDGFFTDDPGAAMAATDTGA